MKTIRLQILPVLAGLVMILAAAIVAAAAGPSLTGKDFTRLSNEISRINRDAGTPQGPGVIEKQLAADFKVSSDKINVILGSMMEYGDVAASLAFAEKLPGGINDRNVNRVMDKRFKGSWSQAAQDLGVDPMSIAARLNSVERRVQTALAEAAAEGRAAGGAPAESPSRPDRSDPQYQ